jgi:hypothetical protein
MRARASAGTRHAFRLAIEVKPPLLSVCAPGLFKDPYFLGWRDTESAKRQDHGADAHIRFGGFPDVPTPRASDDWRTDMAVRTNLVQHCIQMIPQCNHLLKR